MTVRIPKPVTLPDLPFAIPARRPRPLAAARVPVTGHGKSIEGRNKGSFENRVDLDRLIEVGSGLAVTEHSL